MVLALKNENSPFLYCINDSLGYSKMRNDEKKGEGLFSLTLFTAFTLFAVFTFPAVDCSVNGWFIGP